MTSESIVVVEGYDDRNFWAEWLERAGWNVLKHAPRQLDPFGDPVVTKHYWYDRAGEHLRIVPVEGKDNVLRTVRNFLRLRAERALRCIVACLDSDKSASDLAPSAARTAAFTTAMTAAGGAPSGSAFSFDAGATSAHLVVWHDSIATLPGVPDAQTLERIVCGAIAHVYPGRAAAVAAWLTATPTGSGVAEKEHAWSYMAKWEGDGGCNDFYRRVWRDAAVAAELDKRLTAIGATAVLAAL